MSDTNCRQQCSGSHVQTRKSPSEGLKLKDTRPAHIARGQAQLELCWICKAQYWHPQHNPTVCWWSLQHRSEVWLPSLSISMSRDMPYLRHCSKIVNPGGKNYTFRITEKFLCVCLIFFFLSFILLLCWYVQFLGFFSFFFSFLLHQFIEAWDFSFVFLCFLSVFVTSLFPSAPF